MWIVQDALDKGHGGDKGHSVFCQGLGKTIFLEVDLIASHSCLPINAANVHSRFSLKDSKSLKVQPFHEQLKGTMAIKIMVNVMKKSSNNNMECNLHKNRLITTTQKQISAFVQLFVLNYQSNHSFSSCRIWPNP